VPDSREATELLRKTAKLDKSILRGAYVKRDDKFFAQCDDHLYEVLPFNAFIDSVKQSLNEPIKATTQSNTESTQPNNKSIDYFAQLSVRSVKINKTVEAMALFKEVSDPKVFFIAAEGEDFENMMSLCASLGSKFDDRTRVTPVVGEVYLARAIADNETYRAVVLEVIGDQCRVQYIDFGNEEVIDSSSLMQLTPEMSVSSVAPIAIKCRVDSTKLSADNLEKKLDQAIDGSFLIKIKILSIENSVHSVEVY